MRPEQRSGSLRLAAARELRGGQWGQVGPKLWLLFDGPLQDPQEQFLTKDPLVAKEFVQLLVEVDDQLEGGPDGEVQADGGAQKRRRRVVEAALLRLEAVCNP